MVQFTLNLTGFGEAHLQLILLSIAFYSWSPSCSLGFTNLEQKCKMMVVEVQLKLHSFERVYKVNTCTKGCDIDHAVATAILIILNLLKDIVAPEFPLNRSLDVCLQSH